MVKQQGQVVPKTSDLVCRSLFTLTKMKLTFPGNLETAVVNHVEHTTVRWKCGFELWTLGGSVCVWEEVIWGT